MGLELLSYAVYNTSIHRANDFLRTIQCQWSVLGEIPFEWKLRHVADSHVDELSATNESSKVDDPAISQPLTTALQIALVDLLRSWGIHPSAVVGHSSGEIAAAYCAGAISEKSAWKLAYYRGLLASRLAKAGSGRHGSMMAVALSEEAITPYLNPISAKNTIIVACVNSPVSVTVSGNEDAVTDLQKILERARIFARRLPIGVAYHSAQMDDIAAEYLNLIGDLEPPQNHHSSANSPLMYSSVTGSLVIAEHPLRAEYWVSNMRSKVRFSDALSQMCYEKDNCQYRHDSPSVSFLIEVGPHSMLRRPIAETVGEVGYVSALRINTSAVATILHLAAELCCLGCKIDLWVVNRTVKDTEAQMLVDLPAYPFNHSQSYWHEGRLSKNFRFREHPTHELLGTPFATSNSLEAEWKNAIKVTDHPWIMDHRFNGSNLYPAAGMVVMAVEAARQTSSSAATRPIKGYRLVDVNFLRAVRLSTAEEGVQTQFYLRPQRTRGTASYRREFRLYMISNDEWIENCYGTIITEYEEDDIEVDRGFESQQKVTSHQEAFTRGIQQCHKKVDSERMYGNLKGFGFGFGPTFQTLGQISYNDEGEATATINLHAWQEKVPAETRVIQRHVIHPTALDGVFQLTVAAITRGGWVSIPTMVPTRLHSLWISNSFFTRPDLITIEAYSNSRAEAFREAGFDVISLDLNTKEPLIILDGYRATAVTSLDMSSSSESHWRRLCYSIDVRPDIDLLDKDSLATYCNDSVHAKHVLAEDFNDTAELKFQQQFVT
ncbi:MAG: hypothetical protein LQ349_009335, partial [Xanthoria aureola]